MVKCLKNDGDVKTMTVFNISGKGGFEKHLLEHESRHNAVIKEIQDVMETADYNDPAERIEKIPIVFDVGGKELSMLATNKITRGSGTFSNSKLFDVIDKAGLTDDLVHIFSEGEVSNADILEFLRGRLVGRICEVELKTANLKKPVSEHYSMISKVVKFTDVKGTMPSAPKESVESVKETENKHKQKQLK